MGLAIDPTADAAPTPTIDRPRRGRLWTIRVLFAILVLAAIAWAAGETAARRARAELGAQAQTAAALHAAVLRSELEKHRSLPFVLAEDPDVRAVLVDHGAASTAALNRKLEALSQQTRAAVIYVLDADGLTLAASNWRLPTSFVGSNYGFRPYYRNAARSGAAEYFALGTVSGRPGLFLARRVMFDGRLLGVVVVKVEFDALEAEWRRSGDPAYVVDHRGVVLVTSVPQWRFRTEHPIPPRDLADMRRNLQFGAGPLGPLPFRATSQPMEVVAQAPGQDEQTYRIAQAPTTAPGWTLRLLTPTAPGVPTAVTAARAVALILGGLAFAGIGLLIRRREVEASRAAAREAGRIELEHQVLARTAELRNANQRLRIEMEERRRAEASMHTLQDELVQANKLAMLGQIAAGVAHEINQPVAAIRTYADNAGVLLDRDQREPLRKNLAVIRNLTDRIGAITGELRAFSRKTAGRTEPVVVEDAIAGVLLLLGASFRARGVQFLREGAAPGARVQAERVRLEQVLMNLLQNALDAVADAAEPTVRLGVSAKGGKVTIRIVDNGPGLSEPTRAALFTPFNTTKANGVGLGLVISHDIVREFGGELLAEPNTDRGASFVVILKQAK